MLSRGDAGHVAPGSALQDSLGEKNKGDTLLDRKSASGLVAIDALDSGT